METLTSSPSLQAAVTVPDLSSGLDFYKVTMSQLAFTKEPDLQATSTFHNRGKQRIMDYVDLGALREQFDATAEQSWTAPELQYLTKLTMNGGQPTFSADYRKYLASNKLPRPHVWHDRTLDDIAVEATGDWPLQTFWETVIMSAITETYFSGYLKEHDIKLADVYREGDRRLSEKIAVLQQRPDIKIIDFGTRRRFSLAWHEHVLERLATECPTNLIGTSNLGLAHKFGLKPIGTFAHEMPMAYAALADARGQDIRASHQIFLDDWFDLYGKDFSIALTDTFGTKFFFKDFTPKQAADWNGTRQDSGDEFEYGNQELLPFYRRLGIDPQSKQVVFSNSLDLTKIVKLQDTFGGTVRNTEGWGTGLVCDMPIAPLNIVMKLSGITDPRSGNSATTVKLSNDPGKHTGTPENIARYQHIFS